MIAALSAHYPAVIVPLVSYLAAFAALVVGAWPLFRSPKEA